VAFTDPPNAGIERDRQQDLAETESSRRAGDVSAVVIPALLRAAVSRRWWSAFDAAPSAGQPDGDASAEPAIVELTGVVLDGVRIAARVIAPAEPVAAHDLLRRAIADPDTRRRATAVAAISGSIVVGLAVAAPSPDASVHELLAVGVAPQYRRRGLATALVQRLVAQVDGPWSATVTVAERDVVEPLDIGVRASAARSLLRSAGFREVEGRASEARIDRHVVAAERS
jgi:ribosomal protein S18 acetylase RimI-like enzyme